MPPLIHPPFALIVEPRLPMGSLLQERRYEEASSARTKICIQGLTQAIASIQPPQLQISAAAQRKINNILCFL
ncbi:hypothetical protein [Coleofasciculus sp. FACHB-T130]|uniref:hypothetical protein n=2 Tax=Cyanophyceae TaxID=3028117 RepID=UPI001A7E9A6C|nr:hypothetical protein [Coleofasciculus sp. FACHB-T130]